MRNLQAKVITAFWNKVEIKTEAECWPWLGNITTQGYGCFNFPVKQRERAHRLAYELVRGPIPDGKVTDHLCRNRACCNPYHIELVSNKVNVLRGVGRTAINAVKDTCKNGHPFTPENTLGRYGGLWRGCRICKNLSNMMGKRKARAKQRQVNT
jgi:hypothetical protein